MPNLFLNVSDVINNFRKEISEGKSYIVVNGVPVIEKVLNDYLLPAEEIGRFYQAWNGAPITLRHPKQNNGSANHPVPDVPIIGRFYQASFDGKRLTGEYWIDEQLLKAHSIDTYNKIISGKPVETSTGYYSDEEDAHGVFNEIAYKTIHRNLRPDHIAILPDEVGACSVSEGCGVNQNHKGDNMDLKQLLAFVQGKGLKVKINEQQGGEASYEVEETPPVAEPPAPAPTAPASAPAFTEQEMAALKALAASAPVLQNAATIFTNETKARKDSLIASIKQNAANVFTDDELNAMPESALAKHNAHLNTNFVGLGGVAEVNQNASIAMPPNTFAWPAPAQGGK